MLKQISKLEILVDGKQHSYMCEHDSNLVQCKEALFQFQKYIGQIEDTAKAAQEKEKQDAEVSVESKIEPIGE